MSYRDSNYSFYRNPNTATIKRIALISDIQGNYTALQSVMAQIKQDNVDQIICLGDVASGAQPVEVLSMLRDNQVHVIKGNMDDAILNPQRHETEDLDIQRFDDIDQWCSDQLSSIDKAYIRSFRPTILVDLVEDKQLLCFHGSPYSYNDVIDETLSDSQLAQLIDGYTEEIMATGHMHHQFLRPFHRTMIVNPGSVGLPRKRDDKHPLYANYALVDIVDSQVNIEFRSVDIPADEFKKGILKSGMPHANWFLSQWGIEV